MKWVDCFGPPGAGKSTLLDHIWRPGWPEYDGKGWPKEWAEFTDYALWLLEHCRGHWSYAACAGMTRRSFNKISTVHRLKDKRLFYQTGLTQRGLGFGWRLGKPGDKLVEKYYMLMPISAGIVHITCDSGTLRDRNFARGKNRSYMISDIARPCEIATEVLSQRGVAFLEIDTTQPVEITSAQLRDFVASCASSADTAAA